MRKTVDLPPAVYRRARELANALGQFLSATLAALTARGMGQLEQPVVVRVDATSGFPVLSLGRGITSDEVAGVLDQE